MRNTADALNELVNGTNGLKSQIDAKISQTTADTLYLGKTAKAASATTADSAGKLTTPRNIALTGAITGNANFDGSGNISIATNNGTISGGVSQSYVDDNFLAITGNGMQSGRLHLRDHTTQSGDENRIWFDNGLFVLYSKKNNYERQFLFNEQITTLFVDGKKYEFESDGIYLNGTKITS